MYIRVTQGGPDDLLQIQLGVEEEKNELLKQTIHWLFQHFEEFLLLNQNSKKVCVGPIFHI